MQRKNFTIELSPDVVNLITKRRKEASKRVKEMVVIELFREGKISTGKAAQILGMKRTDFFTLLAHLGIPYFHQDKEELSQEFSQA